MDEVSGKLIIFDLDGTLYNTEITLIKAIRLATGDLNLVPPDIKRIKSLIGETSKDFCRQIFPSISKAKISQFREKLRFYERQLIPQISELYGGIKEVLEELHSFGYSLAICSNSSREYIKLILSSCDIRQYISFIRGYDPEKSKSDLVGEIMHEAKFSFAVLVGDQNHDIMAARENKLPCIGVTYGYGNNKTGGADFIAECPEHILDFIYQCDLFSKIEAGINNIKSTRAIILGVNGVDTSGKTIFSKLLSKYLRSKGHKTGLVHLDDFHNPKKIRYTESDEIKSYINSAFNFEMLKEELLDPIRQGYNIDKKLKLLDLEADSFSKNIRYHIDSETIMIVEGTLLYREPIDRYFDYRVFLDINFDEVLHRAEQRDVPKYGSDILKKYQDKYIPIQEWYINKYNPREKSDIVINNQNYLRPKILD